MESRYKFMILGDCSKNKWCCFCKNWYDPTNSSIKPRICKNLFDVENNRKNKCLLKNLITPAISSCSSFERKFK